MFISFSLSKPSAVAKKRTADTQSKPANRKIPRMGSQAFLKLGKSKQKQYLKTYPKSSHRFLLSGKKKPKTVPQKVTPVAKPGRPKADMKRVTRKEYEGMNKKQQTAYDKKFAKARSKFVGKKHVGVKKRGAVRPKSKILPAPKYNRLERLSAAEAAIINASREQAHKDLKAAITPEAVRSIAEVKPEDLKLASENIKRDKDTILDGFEEKLESDRLDHVELSDEDRAELQQKVDSDKDDNPEELEAIIKAKKPTKKQKQVAEDALGHKKENFFQRDIAAMGKILRGEKVDKNGKSNFIVAASILTRYMLVAGGVAAIALGAAPLAAHIAKEVYDNWKSLSADDKKDEDYGISKLYDTLADYIQHLDLDDAQASVAKTRFKSESASSAKRISYRSVAEEREIPVSDRSKWRVMLGDKEVGQIYADYDKTPQQNLRIWRAFVTTGFNLLEFPHVDDVETMREPFITTNDTEAEHNLELHCPTLMSLTEARSWVCSIIERNNGGSK